MPKGKTEASVVRILIADDHPAFRSAVRRVLSNSKRYEICGEAVNGREAVDKSIELHPHVVLMDVHMPEMNGFEATRLLRAMMPETEILICTNLEGGFEMEIAFSAGARGYLAKSQSSNLAKAIQAVASHQQYPLQMEAKK